MDKSGAGAGFLRELRFVFPANVHSICFSTIIFTITRGSHNRPGVAAVPIASQTKYFDCLHIHTSTHTLMLPCVRSSVAVEILWLSIRAYTSMLYTVRTCHLYSSDVEKISLLIFQYIVIGMKYIPLSKTLHKLHSA
jgi:hypothetical protein